MTRTFLQSVLLTLIVSCQGSLNNSEESNKNNSKVLDPIAEVPDWLKFEVSKALPLDSLNVWIPTGQLETSSMIRVPRFPTNLSEENYQHMDLERFRIVPIDHTSVHQLSGVRNEQISAQIAVAAKEEILDLSLEVSDLIATNGLKLTQEHIEVRFPQYLPVVRARSELTWTARPEEIYGPEVSGYGAPDVVADPLVELEQVKVPAYRAQPIWLTFKLPKNASAGVYEGFIRVVSENFTAMKVPIAIEILDAEIPDPADYDFFLDLWLNPKAIAISNNLTLWSEEHWALIQKYMEDLISKGAKTITTTMTHDPWTIEWLDGKRHSQTGIGYAPMIQWNLTADSTWTYDYSIFDRYVSLALKSGLSERIDVFSLTPFEWGGKRYVTYFDQKEKRLIEQGFDHQDETYKKYWIGFLADFEKHLREKGWFQKTYLSFDESPKEIIVSILEIVSEGAPDFLNRFSVAGKPVTSDMAQALSIFYEHFSPEYNQGRPVSELIQKRRESNKTTTLYLCGDPPHPNSFTFSPAIESRQIPWLSLKMKTDGYLRWAYNSWSDTNPYKQPVFNFIQGDDYYVYPGTAGPVSSIRWELLKEGIEDFELFEQFKDKLNDADDIIKIATREEDGREKDVNDFNLARHLILKDVIGEKASQGSERTNNTNMPPVTN